MLFSGIPAHRRSLHRLASRPGSAAAGRISLSAWPLMASSAFSIRLLQHRHQHRDLFLVRQSGTSSPPAVRVKPHLWRAEFYLSKAGHHRRFNAMLNVADVRPVAVGGLQHVFL